MGADAAVEAALALIDGATSLELDVDPSPERLDVTLQLEPQAGSDVQTKIGSLVAGDARGLLALPRETSFALGLSRTSEEREAAGHAAGDDWVRLLGARLTARDADQLRSVLGDWELGRGTQLRYGFLGGNEPGAFLVTDVREPARVKRAATGLFQLLSLPGLRAPLAEFLGTPRLSGAGAAAPAALPGASHQRLVFVPAGGRPARVPPLSFAWLVEAPLAFAVVGHDPDVGLRALAESASGRRPTLAESGGASATRPRCTPTSTLGSFSVRRAPMPRYQRPSCWRSVSVARVGA